MTLLQSKPVPQDKTEKLGVRLASQLAEWQNIDSLQLISHYSYALQLKYHSYVLSIIPSNDAEFKSITEGTGHWISNLREILADESLPLAESFAKAKYFLEELFFSITKKGELFYTYRSESLLNSAELQKELGVSRATISRYVQLGMEVVPETGHKRYPLHNTFYWKNGIWAGQLQAQQERYRIRNRTTEQLIEELQAEILAFETAYKGTFEEVFGDIQDPYELSEPDDYFNWQDAIEELERVNE